LTAIGEELELFGSEILRLEGRGRRIRVEDARLVFV
jgi:hypothetical protein